MKSLPGVIAAALAASVILCPAIVLARGGGHVPEIKVPEVHQPRDVKVPDVKVPEVKVPDVKVPEARMPGVPAAGPRDNPTVGRADANIISDVVATRSLDSRAAFLNSAVATRLGEGAGSAENSVKLLADYRRNGRRCRDYQQIVVIAAQRVKAVGTVCQGSDGTWGLVPLQRPARRQ